MEHPSKILEAYGLEPKKSLGQNFLYDAGILRKIAAAADISKDDQILEVGPGLGSLTTELAQRAGRVVTVELDNRLLPVLHGQFDGNERVEVVHQDILKLDPADYFENGTYKVVANVPYYITGAIFRHLLQNKCRPQLMVTTVQKDVAERLVAQPPKMSLLAVSVQFFGQASIVSNLAAGAFWPRPKVSSTVVKVDLVHSEHNVAGIDERLFFRIVKAGFSQKRKQLHNNLRGLGQPRDVVEGWLTSAGIDPRRRAETVSVAEWIEVTKAVASTIDGA